MKIVNDQKGLAQIPLMIGLLLMAVAIPLSTKLVQTNQENRSKATDTVTLKSKANNDLNMNLDMFFKINESNMFGYTGSRLISGVITEINQDTVSIETLNDGIVKTNLMRGDDPDNTTLTREDNPNRITRVFIRNNYSNNDGSYVTLDSLTNTESGRLVIAIFDIKTNNLYKLEIFKKEWIRR